MGPSIAGNDKVSPLALHCWEAIQKQGSLDVAALQPILGRDITEAAIARAMQELWARLYIFPILGATGQPARWELIYRRFPQQVASGASTGHAEAHSAMVSLYLHSAVAAMEDEIIAFLSPLTAQSKLREVIRGLGSMRQLDIIDIDGRSHVCLQGGLLPETMTQLSEQQLEVPLAPEASAIADRESEIQIEAAPQRPWRLRPQGKMSERRQRPDGPKKFAPKEFRPKRFAAGSARGEGAAPKRFEFGERAKRREKFNETASGFPDQGKSPSQKSGSKPYGFKPAGSRPWPLKGTAPEDRTSKSWNTRGPGGRGASGPGSQDRSERTRDHGGQGRSKRLENRGPGSGAPPSGGKPYGPKPSGFRSAGTKPGAFQSAGNKPMGSKPWASRVAGGEGRSKYTPRERGENAAGERPRRWEKPGGLDPAKPAGRKPSGHTASGFKSAGAKSGEARTAGPKSFRGKSAGPKPWASRDPASGAASRIGAARSYAARTAEGARSGDRTKPYVKSGSTKPGFSKSGFSKSNFSKGSGKRAFSDIGNAGERPRQRERTTPDAGEHGAKPFWAKNPRSAKGSAAGPRGNRPKGKKKSGRERQ